VLPIAFVHNVQHTDREFLLPIRRLGVFAQLIMSFLVRPVGYSARQIADASNANLEGNR